jgi:hypothetical protein
MTVPRCVGFLKTGTWMNTAEGFSTLLDRRPALRFATRRKPRGTTDPARGTIAARSAIPSGPRNPSGPSDEREESIER